MTARRLCSSVFGERPRPVTAPTALSMMTAIGLLSLALLLPDRDDHVAATAAELGAVSATQGTPTHPVSLRDRLVAGLQARLPSEIAYVEHVANLVQTGRLPQRLVDETFLWARQRAAASRNGRVRRPIIYFQPAMTARAKRLNIDL